MTLDMDDVELARKLLEHPTGWNDRNTVNEYERQFAEWNGSRNAFAFMGARVALSACISALGLKAGDDVLLPGYTCVVVANALLYAGVTPVYVDIEHDTYGVDLEDLTTKVTTNTRAIIVQHLYGLVSRDYTGIIDFARKRDIKIIEDCAHSTGASLHSTKVGNMGDVAVYSSERSKIFSTVVGGIATTNDAEIAQGLEQYRDRAPEPDDWFTERVLFNVVLDTTPSRIVNDGGRPIFWTFCTVIKYSSRPRGRRCRAADPAATE
jgi:dTDP-4-amino-4,6-dideoxygalactose transaminase